MFTKQQLQAINALNKNITVSASAGAGKTAVLVERLMKRILVDKISVDTIVALTFTDAAAAEMKNRLMSALLDKQAEDPNNDYINQQIILLPNANISTIHSYCLNILKDYYYVLGLDPKRLFNIISEYEELKIHNDIFEKLIINYDKETITNTLSVLSNSTYSINQLQDLLKVLTTNANQSTDPNKFLDESIKIYKSYKTLNDIPEPHLTMFFNYHKTAIKSLKKFAYILYDISKDNDAKKQIEWIETVINKFNQIENALNNYDYNTYMRLIEDIASLKNTIIRKNTDYATARDNYYKTLESIVVILYSEEELLSNLAKNERFTNDIISLSKTYNTYYLEALDSLNKITFNQMETLTYKLISKNNDEIANILKNEINDILVDEFQDTNILQDAIITKISRGNNVFRVGDIKQSIYRFRGAKPQIMQSLIDQGDTSTHQNINLSHNFRSKHSIVEYINHFYKNLMNHDILNFKFSEDDYVTVGLTSQKENIQNIKLHLVNKNIDTYEGLDENYNLSDTEFKAHHIASEIVKLYEADNDKKWSKYTVLVESHMRKLSLKAAFDKANIPYFISFPDGLFETLGVSVINAYLKLVSDPSDLISLVSILVNLYGYSENDISSLYLEYQDLHKVSNALDKSILDDIYYFNNNHHKISVKEIVDHILLINNFYEQQLSKQSRTNTDLFYELVIEYDQEASGVYGFLDMIDLIKQSKASEGSSISSDDNVVNVMTIHNSKGLQFDTVFILSKHNIRSKNNAGYLLHPDLGLGIKTTNLEYRNKQDNIASFIIDFYDKLEELEEEMRKFYVAMTRAQNDLYIVDTYNIEKEIEIEEFSEHFVISNSGLTKWLLALNKDKPNEFLEIEYFEKLEYSKTSEIIKSIDTIYKFEKIDKDQTISNSFIPSKLDFSLDKLGVDIGTLIHKTIENLDDQKYTYDNIKNISPDISDYFIEKLINLGNNEFFLKLKTHEVYYEYPFIILDDNNYKQGFIDFLSISDKNIYIIDFKTDNLDKENEFIDRYKEQINGYINAVEKLYSDKSVSAYIYSLNLDTFISF